MSHEVGWTKRIVDEFVNEAMLSSFEEEVLRTRVKGMSRVEQSMMLGCSVLIIDRCIADLKEKYDAVSAYDVLLPPRNKFHKMLPKY